MARQLTFLTNGPPAGQAKTFIDFVLSPRGQELVKKHGYLRLSDLKVKAAVAAKP
jgi:phosphate transport system substrate-binding protein